eukprot:scaffold491683_cov46-Prasinocladus_malaysianus.AAC.1
MASPAPTGGDCKTYTCSDSGEEAILVALDFQCVAEGPPPPGLEALDADPSLGFCSIQAELSVFGSSATLVCEAYNCSLAPGVLSGSCPGLLCNCPDGCLGVDSIIADLSSTAFDCSGGDATGNATSCQLDVGGAPIPLSASLGC